MNIQRLREIEALGISPSEHLEYSLIKNPSPAIAEALLEHGLGKAMLTNGLDQLMHKQEPEDPEEALTFALDNLSETMLTVHLKPYGYQPIPKRKQAKREAALSH